MNRILAPLAFASAVLLAGCEFSGSVTPTPPPFDPPTRSVDAVIPSNPGTIEEEIVPVAIDVELAPGEERWYEVHVSEAVASAGDLLYIEADAAGNLLSTEAGSIQVRVYNDDGTVRLTGEGPYGFGSGISPAPIADASSLQTSGIDLARLCLDACGIVPAVATDVVVRVKNVSEVSRTADVYAYTLPYGDTTEDENDRAPSAPFFSDTEQGAIETLGDGDIYEVDASGVLEFRSNGPLELRADVVAGDRLLDTLMPGDEYEVRVGDLVIVYSDGGFAGPPSPSASGYTLDIN